MIQSRRYILLTLVPALAVMVSLVAFPMLFTLSLSFRSYVLTDPNAPRDFVGLENFVRLFSDARFRGAALRSVVFTLISVGVSMVLGFGVGHYLSLNIRGKNLLRTLLIVPLVTTPLVIGAAFRFMFDFDLGVFNYFMESVGLPRVKWLSDPSLALPVTALVDAWQWLPFVALVVAAGFEALPRDAIEAAQVDGASRWQELRYVVLPMLRPLLVIVLLMRFMDAFREFDKIFIMTAGGPGTSSETLPIYIWRFTFNYYNMGFAAAAGVTMLLAITFISGAIVSRTRILEGH